MSRAISVRKVALIVGVAMLGLLMASAAQATIITNTITSADFTFGYGATVAGAQTWTTTENSGNNSPTTQGDFSFVPTVTGPYGTGSGPTFLSRVLGNGGTTTGVCGYQGSTANPWAASIAASWSGATPPDALPDPNYRLELEITGISIYGTHHPASAGGYPRPIPTLNFHESTTGNVGNSTPVTLPQGGSYHLAAAYLQVVWDPTDFQAVGTTSTRTFAVVVTPNDWVYPGDGNTYINDCPMDGFEVFGKVHLTYDAIPEPSTLALLVTGLAGLLCYAWRKRR